MEKLHEIINDIIPHIDGNFITYPLWEEGIYIPQVNFWLRHENKKSCIQYFNGLVNNLGYEVFRERNEYDDELVEYALLPKIERTILGGYDVINKDWSIEEMVDLVRMLIVKYYNYTENLNNK